MEGFFYAAIADPLSVSFIGNKRNYGFKRDTGMVEVSTKGLGSWYIAFPEV